MEDEKNVGWGVCMKQFICGAWPSTTEDCVEGALERGLAGRERGVRGVRGQQRRVGLGPLERRDAGVAASKLRCDEGLGNETQQGICYLGVYLQRRVQPVHRRWRPPWRPAAPRWRRLGSRAQSHIQRRQGKGRETCKISWCETTAPGIEQQGARPVRFASARSGSRPGQMRCFQASGKEQICVQGRLRHKELHEGPGL